MATYDEQLQRLQKQVASHQSALDRSPTASSSGAVPTDDDLFNETRKKKLEDQIQRVKNTQLKEAWYGTGKRSDDTDNQGVQEGLIGKALHAAASPLYGIVGGIEALTGQGTKKGLANIAENIKERETFSDLLKKNKVPTLLAAPLGFALDVAFDPVNWSVVGAAATIPRTAIGLAKGGLRGAAAGAGSNLASAGAAITGFATLGAKTKLRSKLAETGQRLSKEFNELTGFDPEAAAISRGPGTGVLGQGLTSHRLRLGDTAKELITKLPGGDKLWDALNYDNLGYIKLSKLDDSVSRRTMHAKPNMTAEEAGDLLESMPISSLDELESGAKSLDDIIAGDRTFAPNREMLDKMPPGEVRDYLISRIDDMADDVDFVLKNPEAVSTANPAEQMLRLSEEAAELDIDRKILEDLKKQFRMNSDETGIKWFDDAAQKVREFKVGDFEAGKTAMDAYSSLIRWFKQAKTGLNPATGVANAVSAPALMMLYGMKFRPEMVGEFISAYNFLGGRNAGKFLANSGMFDEASAWIRYMADNPKTFSRTFGMSPKYALGRSMVDKIMQTGRDLGISVSASREEMMAQIDKMVREASDDLQDIVGAARKPLDNKGGALPVASGAPVDRWENITAAGKTKAAPTPSQTAREMRAAGDEVGGVSWSGSEFIDDNAMARFSQKVAEKAETEGGWWKAMNMVLNETMTSYEQIDQAWRLTIAKRLTKDGIDEAELATMSRITGFGQGDIISKSYDPNGKLRFHLSPDKATEISSDILFNYAAMPPAIRMMRNMPFLGAPFASFMYGSALRTAQALAYNPSSFNKITWALNSVEGQKGPTERKALESDYYQWYNSPTMVRLPFFEEYPLYLNAANVLPYYSLSLFEPGERRYNEFLPDAMVSTIDKSPLMKDPVGQLLFDYIILPSIIRDSQPLNSFGQPLAPMNATGLEKFGYLARSAADVVTPGLISPAGLMAPDGTGTYLPGYRTRQIAEATQGRSQLGIEGKEPASSRVLRALSGWAGAPVQRLDPSAARNEIE